MKPKTKQVLLVIFVVVMVFTLVAPLFFTGY